MAENVHNLIRNIGIENKRLREILKSETVLGRGAKILNLSPYSIIVQSLMKVEPGLIRKFLDSESAKIKIFVPREIEMPSDFDGTASPNIVFSPAM